MTDYLNPDIPEGINVSPEHPLKEFAQLVTGVTIVIALLAWCLSELAVYGASRMSIEQEMALSANLPSLVISDSTAKPEALDARERLQTLATRLSRHMAIPATMPITVHYSPEPVVNAMATLGGHIVVYQGLLEATQKSDTALAMVMAHELAHIQLRHPATAMGRNFALALLLSTFAGLGDNTVQGWANSVGTLTTLRYSREQENAADQLALEAVYLEYGTVEGADGFFQHISTQAGWLEPPAILSTHPGHEERIQIIQAFTATHSPHRSTP